jgi:hypothetical protein
MKTNPASTPAKPGEITSFSVLVARLLWVLAGPLALLGITYSIMSGGTGWLTGRDAAFGIVVGLMLLGRWYEHRSGEATTLTGEVATPEDFRRYMRLVPALAVVIWVVANALGNHIIN